MHIKCALRLAAIAVLAAVSLSAQWLNYPTRGLPKKADGSPNLTAPAPKLPDGHPDFSGVWMTEQDRPCDPEGCRDLPVGEQFFNIGHGLPGGLPYQPWAAALVKQRMADNAKDDPDPFCLPQGIMKMHTAPLMRKYLQMPGMFVILNERNATYRQIFMDGGWRTIRTRRGAGTRWERGRAMPWWCIATGSRTTSGWIAAGVP